jgi:ribosomal-protein-alanine N-acetyltransferase
MKQVSRFPTTLETERFVLKELELKDVTEKYLTWFSEKETMKWVVTAPNTKRLTDLKRYVSQRVGRSDVLFLGIFEKLTGAHVGNIKYEPINLIARSAVMGVLLGDPGVRGKGVFLEVLKVSSKWLRCERGVSKIVLGVDKRNLAAINAYRHAGFVDDEVAQATAAPGALMMVLHV